MGTLSVKTDTDKNNRAFELIHRRSLLGDVGFFDGILLSLMLFVISSYIIFSLEVLMAER